MYVICYICIYIFAIRLYNGYLYIYIDMCIYIYKYTYTNMYIQIYESVLDDGIASPIIVHPQNIRWTPTVLKS